ncbi:hypothetical protein NUW58_g1005 [Xylaria curta]|uniref:Uncharacterized protein n=1 Tax=Xylaria curta TaxID=42375 RepID=A0ACC1PPN6_9PEZI|nr:hypothetical protein NUW58_g1005 [Xylaria curta]
MGSLADLFPPGTDLCQLPSGSPPLGQAPDFDDVGLRSLTIAFSVILTTIAITFALGRLFANHKKLGLSDLFVFLAALTNIAHAVLIIVYARYNRHQWNLPLCWINGEWELASYTFETLNNFSLFFSKSATLLLFRQVFSVSRTMNIAIWVGVAASFALYGSSLATLSYFAAPHAGQTWDELAAHVAGTTIFPLYWGVAQGAVGTILDIYIFVLPLPTLSRLNLSTKRKLQVSALFFVAILGVVGSTVSLAYRALSIQGPNPDYTYNAGVLLNCNLIEMNIALIICSTPAFASFMRNYVMQSKIFRSLQSSLGGSRSGPRRSGLFRTVLDPNRPRTGRDKQKPSGEKDAGRYIEMSDTWLLKSGATVDVEAPNVANKPSQNEPGEPSEGLKVVKTVDVEHFSVPSAT